MLVGSIVNLFRPNRVVKKIGPQIFFDHRVEQYRLKLEHNLPKRRIEALEQSPDGAGCPSSEYQKAA